MDLLVIDGHPDPDSLCAALVREYADAARDAGARVEVLPLRDLDFDPHLRRGLRDHRAEPDILRARTLLVEADHVVVVSPVWWGSVPALLKGFFDRTLERGWAYRYRDNGLPQGLLSGRSGRVVITTDSPGVYLRWIKGDTTMRQIRRSTLRFCGLRPVDVTRFGPVHGSTDRRRAGWLREIRAVAARDAARTPRPDKARPEVPLTVG